MNHKKENEQSSFNGELLWTIPLLMLLFFIFMDRPTTAASIDRCKLPGDNETEV